MENVYRIIKKQIDKQTQKYINTDLSKTQPHAFTSNEEEKYIGGGDINPIWTIGSYVLEKNNLIQDGLQVNEFKNYSGKIRWELIQGRTIERSGLPQYSNVLVGIQFFSTEKTNIEFPMKVKNGYLCIYRLVEDESEYEKVFEYNYGGKANIVVPIKSNSWTHIIFTFYAYSDGASFSFVPRYNNVHSWRYLDITSPDIPQWAATPLERFHIDQNNTTRTKIRLNWIKDNSVDFGGNGIYKYSVRDSGLTTQVPIPSPALKNEFPLYDEVNKWITVNSNSTLNIGDSISFSSSGNPTYVITNVVETPENKVTNPIFANGTYGYYVSPSISLRNDAYGYYNNSYVKFKKVGRTGSFAIKSPAIDVNTGSLYICGFVSDNDLMSRYKYYLGSYGTVPSGWETSGSISVEATIRGNFDFIEVVRSGSGTIKTENNSIYFSRGHYYEITCSASFPQVAPYKISFNLNSGTTLWSSSTLFGGSNYIISRAIASCSSSGYGYFKFHILSTTASYNFATLHFGNVNIADMYSKKGVTDIEVGDNYFDLFGLTEKLRITLADSAGHTLTATPYYDISILYDDYKKIRTHSVLIGSIENATASSMVLPSSCKKIYVSYIAQFKNTVYGGTLYVERNIHNFFVNDVTTKSSFKNITGIHATPYHWIRLSNSATVPSGSTIYLASFEHILDRDRNPSDGAISYWDDYDIDNNTTYYYYLDSYDNSPFRNRSGFSSIASIYSGDTTAPLPPSSYTIENSIGGLIHNWINPTANDLSRIVCYGSNMATIIFDISAGATGRANSYSEIVNGTQTKIRRLVAVDLWGNESTSVLATGHALTATQHDLGFQVIIKDATTGKFTSPDYGESFYNRSIRASIILNNNVAVASYQYRYATKETNSLGGWLNFSGNNTYSGEFSYIFYYRIKDIYGNYSDSHEFNIFIDKHAPTISDRDNYWKTDSRDDNKYNYLSFDNTLVYDRWDPYWYWNSTVEKSGFAKTLIRRDRVIPLNNNPFFLDGIDGQIPLYWKQAGAGASVQLSSDVRTLHGEKTCEVVVNSSSLNKVLRSNTFNLNASDTVYGIARVCASISFAATVKISFVDYDSGSVVASYYRNLNNTGTTWNYFEVLYNASSSATCYLGLQFESSSAVIGESFLVDEMVAFKNINPTLIIGLTSKYDTFVDSDVVPWNYYVYANKLQDNVGNISGTVPLKILRPVQDYRDIHRNIIDNGSFERVYKTSNGTLLAESWTNTHEGAFDSSDVTYDKYYIEENPYAFNGKKVVALKKLGIGYPMVIQNGIQVLPYTGHTRKFILSVYAAKASTVGESAFMRINAKDKNRDIISYKNVSLSLDKLSSYSDWTRTYATFYVSTASITNFSVLFYTTTGNTTVYIDGVQLEEKDSLPPSEFYDNKSITADYIQGNFIRAHMIEADSILSQHITSNSILTEHLTADCVVATSIAANAVRTEHIYSNSITASKLKLEGADIYIKDREELPMELGTSNDDRFYPCVYPATFHQTDLGAACGYVNVYKYSGITRYYTGLISHTFNESSVSGDHQQPFATYYGMPLLYATRPFDANGYYFMCMATYAGGATVYGAYRQFPTIRDLSVDFTMCNGPIATDMNIRHLELRSNQNNFYLLGRKDSNQQYFDFIKLSNIGTIENRKNVYAGGYINDIGFDCNSNGTFLVAYADSYGYNIHCVGYSPTGTVVVSTFSVETFSGLSKNVVTNLYSGYRPEITSVNVAYSTLNKFVLSYTLQHSALIYYKVLTLNGTILVGSDMDMFLTTNKVPNRRYGNGMLPHRLVSGFNGNVLCYIPATFTSDYVNGKATYLTRAKAQVDLEELFNRVT